MRLKITDNASQFEAQMDAFRDAVLQVAVPRAANTLRDQAQTAGFRQIAQTYGISANTMAQYASSKVASANDPQAGITVKGKGFPLSTFKPVQTATGVRVTVKGRTFTVPHAFIVARFGGNVFARGSYGGKYGGKQSGESFGRFLFNRSRLPISKLLSFAPPDCLDNQAVRDAMDARMDEQAGKVLAREIAAARRGF